MMSDNNTKLLLNSKLSLVQDQEYKASEDDILKPYTAKAVNEFYVKWMGGWELFFL